MKFDFYEDPGHGWLKVPVKLLEDLEIAHRITHYSYLNRRRDHAFLEEDVDAPLFIRTMKEKRDIEVNLRHHCCDGQSRIRYNSPYLLRPRFKSFDAPFLYFTVAGIEFCWNPDYGNLINMKTDKIEEPTDSMMAYIQAYYEDREIEGILV
jgi:hypothetical protein